MLQSLPRKNPSSPAHSPHGSCQELWCQLSHHGQFKELQTDVQISSHESGRELYRNHPSTPLLVCLRVKWEKYNFSWNSCKLNDKVKVQDLTQPGMKGTLHTNTSAVTASVIPAATTLSSLPLAMP